ncbi:MAG: hypothetical protein ABI983_07125 [Acidobacteriota bacterium]
MTTLVRSERPHDHDVDGLRARVTELESLLGERHAEVDRTRADLDAFSIKYRQAVGLLHEELDRLELELAEVELGIITGRLADDANDSVDSPAVERPEPAPRFTSDAVRKLFRDVAKAIHPDLAEGDEERDRRHALMVEANRAYELGDEERLRLILQAWERSPDAVQGVDLDAMRQRLIRRLEQVEAQLETLAIDLAAMKGSSLWKLKAMVDEEATAGKNLIEDMIRRLKRDMLVTTNRLDALRG